MTAGSSTPLESILHTGFLDWSSLGALGVVMQNPIFWSTAIMISIVALLFSWEQAVASARHALPETLQPVVDSMLVEMGGLGFIGLFLSITVVDGPLGGLVGGLSQQFLGNPHIYWKALNFCTNPLLKSPSAFFSLPP